MSLEYVILAKGARGWPRVRQLLDGRFYSFEAIWIAAEGFYSINLFDADGELLQAGLTPRTGEDMFAPFNKVTMPGDGLGRLKAWDDNGQDRDPGRDDLTRDSSVRLVYSPRADVLAVMGEG